MTLNGCSHLLGIGWLVFFSGLAGGGAISATRPVPPLAVLLGTVELDKQSVRIELHENDKAEAGLYPIGGWTTDQGPALLPDLFAKAAAGKIGKGCSALVGRMDWLYSAKDEFHVAEFVRQENRIVVRIQYVRQGEDYGMRGYVGVPLAKDLAPGRYYALVTLREFLREGNQLVPALFTKPCVLEHLTCVFEVPAGETAVKEGTWLLPGSKVSVREAMGKKFAFAAVCEAAQDCHIRCEGTGGYETWQEMNVLDVLAVRRGEVKSGQKVSLNYQWIDLLGLHETFLSKGQRVIWIARQYRSSAPDYFVGIKALADTAENRKAVLEAIPKADAN